MSAVAPNSKLKRKTLLTTQVFEIHNIANLCICEKSEYANNGVFPLPGSDSYTDSYEIGFNDNVQNCFHWTLTDSYSHFDSNGYCTQFGTNKVEFFIATFASELVPLELLFISEE